MQESEGNTALSARGVGAGRRRALGLLALPEFSYLLVSDQDRHLPDSCLLFHKPLAFSLASTLHFPLSSPYAPKLRTVLTAVSTWA